MKKRKLLSSVLVTMMVTSTLAPAVFAAEESGTQTGGVVSEGNPADEIFRVVLPTTTVDTYDMILDPYDLLSTSSLNGDRASYDGSSVYFTKSTLPTVTASGTLYASKIQDVADVTAFDINDYVTVAASAVTAVTDNSLYVWAPKAGSEALGVGEFVELDDTNLETYFTLALSATAVDSYVYAETEACDGLLYVAAGAAVTAADAVSYCTITSDDVTAVSGLYTDIALTTAAVFGDLTYNKAVVSHTKKSAAVTAKNKSTFGVVLNVKTDVTNTTDPVLFTTTAAVEGDTALNMSVDILGDDASVVANVEKNASDNDGTTNVDFYLSGTKTNYTQYQGAIDADTGGHTYNFVEKTDAVWSEVDFSVQAACNTTADWTDYNANLTAGNRISMDVVYTMTSAEDVVATPGDNYNATTGVINLVADVAPTIGTTSYVIDAGTAEDVTVGLGSGTLAATGITSITDGGTPIDAGNYTLVGSTLTFTDTYVDTLIGAGTANVNKSLVVVFNDTAATSVTITLTATLPSANNVTYSKASAADIVIPVDMGEGALAATAITDIVVKAADGYHSINGTFSSNKTYASSFSIDNTADTVTIKYTGWLEYYAAGAFDAYIVFDNDPTSYVKIDLTINN